MFCIEDKLTISNKLTSKLLLKQYELCADLIEYIAKIFDILMELTLTKSKIYMNQIQSIINNEVIPREELLVYKKIQLINIHNELFS